MIVPGENANQDMPSVGEFADWLNGITAGAEQSSVDHQNWLSTAEALHRSSGILATIHSLPPETLGYILLLCTSERATPPIGDAARSARELLSLSHVSRHWRDVSLGTPQLWANIQLWPFGNSELAMVDAMLTRSKDTLVQFTLRNDGDRSADYTVRVSDHQFLACLNKVMEHGTRLSHLHLHFPSNLPFANLSATLNRLEAPKLAVLALIVEPGREALHLPSGMLGANYPQLQELTLGHCTNIDWDAPIFCSLTSLHLEHVPRHALPTMGRLCSTLGRMPQLAELTIIRALPSVDFLTLYISDQGVVTKLWPDAHSTTLPALRRCTIRGELEPIWTFLQMIQAHYVVSFHFVVENISDAPGRLKPMMAQMTVQQENVFIQGIELPTVLISLLPKERVLSKWWTSEIGIGFCLGVGEETPSFSSVDALYDGETIRPVVQYIMAWQGHYTAGVKTLVMSGDSDVWEGCDQDALAELLSRYHHLTTLVLIGNGAATAILPTLQSTLKALPAIGATAETRAAVEHVLPTAIHGDLTHLFNMDPNPFVVPPPENAVVILPQLRRLVLRDVDFRGNSLVEMLVSALKFRKEKGEKLRRVELLRTVGFTADDVAQLGPEVEEDVLRVTLV